MDRILPKILVALTRHSRHLPCEERLAWRSDLWIVNIFTLWRRLFWEPAGIQADVSFSMSSRDRKVVYAFHTTEALLSHIEATVRGLMPRKFPVRVWIPVFNTPQGIPMFASPYLFAIAFDTSNSTQSATSTSTTGSVALTIASGSALIGHTLSINPAQVVTSMKWNTTETLTVGTTRTQGTTFTDDLSYHATPTSGASNIDVVYGSGCEFTVQGVSLTGVHATPLGDTDGSGTASGTSMSLTAMDTTVDNSWVVIGGCINGGQATVETGTNQTSRQDFTHTVASTVKVNLSTQTTTTAGNYVSGYSWTPARVANIVGIEIKASVATSIGKNFLVKQAVNRASTY